MSLLLHKSFVSQYIMEDILDNVELMNLKRNDCRFKELCDILLDPDLEVSVNEGFPKIHRSGLTMKQRLSIELDRAMLWRGLYEYNRSTVF